MSAANWLWRRTWDEQLGDVYVTDAPDAPRALIPLARPSAADEALGRVARAGLTAVVVHGHPRGPGPWAPGVVCLDTSEMAGKLEVDTESLVARARAGITWDSLENQLRQWGCTVGPLPQWLFGRPVLQSFALNDRLRPSPRYGQLTDNALSLQVALPGGGLTRSAISPRRATGPELHSLILGAEHRAGLLTELHIQVFRLPTERVHRAVSFSSWGEALAGTTRVLTAGLRPAWWRLQPIEGRLRLLVALEGVAELTRQAARFDAAIGGASLDPGLAIELQAECFPPAHDEDGFVWPLCAVASAPRAEVEAVAAGLEAPEVWDIRPEGVTFYRRNSSAPPRPALDRPLIDRLIAGLTH